MVIVSSVFQCSSCVLLLLWPVAYHCIQVWCPIKQIPACLLLLSQSLTPLHLPLHSRRPCLCFTQKYRKALQCPMRAFHACRSPDATGQDGSQSPSTPVANAPLALTPVHTRYPEEGSGSVHPPSARLQPAKSVSRRGAPAKSATFPNASSSSFTPGASSAVQRSKAQHVSDEHNSRISFWAGQHGSTPGRLGSVEESMQPGTPTSGCTSDAMWEQQANSPWSLRLPHCKPLRIARQHSGSDTSTSKIFEDASTPCSPKASPKIMVVCRICEEQASIACHVWHM